MTTYLGYDLLEARPNAREDPTDTQLRAVTNFDPGMGQRSVVAQENPSRIQRPYLWTCFSKPEVYVLKSFLRSRKGRAIPFWVPSGRKDLILAANMTATDAAATIKACGYTRYQFPSTSRRHLAFVPYSGAAAYRKVLAAAEIGTTQESLTLDNPIGVAFSGYVQFLLLVRLASDDLEIQWLTDEIAECQFNYVEVPHEVPA